MSRVPQLRDSLMIAAERQAKDRRRAGWRATTLRRRRLSSRLTTLAVVAGCVAGLGGVAYAATRAIFPGHPIRSAHLSPTVGVGVAVPRTTGLDGIAAKNPGGGPPWTLRLFHTTRGLGCIQIGRLVNGQIGVISAHGRFDSLPPQVSAAAGNCVLLDRRGRAFLAMSAYGVRVGGQARSCTDHCTSGATRDIFYGVLGSDARSITYSVAGKLHTVPTIGRQGVYLIVLPGNTYQTKHAIATPSIVPASNSTQPIRRISYTQGRYCKLTAHGNVNREGKACQPIGYTPRRASIPRDIRSHVTVTTTGSGRIGLSFTAKAPVESAAKAYLVSVRATGGRECPGRTLPTRALDRDVRVGQRLSVSIQPATYRPSTCNVSGTVYYATAPRSPTRALLLGAEPLELLEALGFRTAIVGSFRTKAR